jgi:hypothetical protein
VAAAWLGFALQAVAQPLSAMPPITTAEKEVFHQMIHNYILAHPKCLRRRSTRPTRNTRPGVRSRFSSGCETEVTVGSCTAR